jgi:hypothetical protein
VRAWLKSANHGREVAVSTRPGRRSRRSAR